MTLRIYVSGPMTGMPALNFPAFDAASAKLRALGHEVFNPADNDRAVYGPDLAGFDLRSALAADLWWICRHADAVAVLDGWKNSRGARAEVATALALNLQVAHVDGFTETGIRLAKYHIREVPARQYVKTVTPQVRRWG